MSDNHYTELERTRECRDRSDVQQLIEAEHVEGFFDNEHLNENLADDSNALFTDEQLEMQAILDELERGRTFNELLRQANAELEEQLLQIL